MDKSGSAEEYTLSRKRKPAQQPLYGYYTGFRKYNSIASRKKLFGCFRPIVIQTIPIGPAIVPSFKFPHSQAIQKIRLSYPLIMRPHADYFYNAVIQRPTLIFQSFGIRQQFVYKTVLTVDSARVCTAQIAVQSLKLRRIFKRIPFQKRK
jgi:hypothetical protein